MSLRDFIAKQWIDVIQWTEPEQGILAYRYPMQDMEIQNGGKLTVRESQMAAFINHFAWQGRAKFSIRRKDFYGMKSCLLAFAQSSPKYTGARVG